jgi:putative redox protein
VTEGWTEISASWKEESTFIGLNSAGATVQMGTLDGKPGVGPMQLLLHALAGCTGMDIVSILQKKRLKLTDLQVQVRGKRADEYPMVWMEIHLTYLIWGEALQPRDVEQAIRLSEEKYCSVGIMLGKTARITSEYHLYEPGEDAKTRSKA